MPYSIRVFVQAVTLWQFVKQKISLTGMTNTIIFERIQEMTKSKKNLAVIFLSVLQRQKKSWQRLRLTWLKLRVNEII